MADEAKALKEKIGKLLERGRELDKQYRDHQDAISVELESLISGGLGMGDILKRLETHFDGVWCVRYAAGETKRYIWNYAADRANWKRLLKTLDVEELERRVIAYLQNADPFFVKARHSFPLFVRSINQFAGDSGAPQFGKQTTALAKAVQEIKDGDQPTLVDDDVAF